MHSLFSAIRNAFAHGSFAIQNFKDVDGERVRIYFFCNYHEYLKAELILQERTLLNWIEIVKSGYDCLEIENPGGLYGRMTLDQLCKISANTRNPFIANAMEIMNETENRYSGIPTVLAAMEEYDLPAPVFSSERGVFKAVLYNGENNHTVEVTDPDEKLILDFCKKPRSRSELEQLFTGKMTIAYVMSKYIHPLIEKGNIRLTIPDKPKSKNQRYVTVVK